jgi:hypothetical protein
MTTQPEALVLADWLESDTKDPRVHDAAAELRRLHESNTELLAALKDLINCADPHRDWEEIKAARAAIAKAERTTT